MKIKEEKKPIISNKLKRKRLNDIFKRDNPKLAVIKDYKLKRKEKINKNNILSKINSNINKDIFNNNKQKIKALEDNEILNDKKIKAMK